MDPEDFLSPEVGITAVVVAAIFSPRARKVIRQGAVYGMAGLLVAGNAIASLGRSFGQGVKQTGVSLANATQYTAKQSRTNASTTETASLRTSQKSTSDKTTSDTAGE